MNTSIILIIIIVMCTSSSPLDLSVPPVCRVATVSFNGCFTCVSGCDC